MRCCGRDDDDDDDEMMGVHCVCVGGWVGGWVVVVVGGDVRKMMWR